MLCQRLHAYLSPGAQCFIGNFDVSNPTRWGMEHLGDWYLIHRTRDELREVADGIGPETAVSVDAESTGVNLILTLTRP